MNSIILFILFLFSIFLMSLGSDQKDILQYYQKSTKYTVPKRQTLISAQQFQPGYNYQVNNNNFQAITSIPRQKVRRPGMIYHKSIVFRDENTNVAKTKKFNNRQTENQRNEYIKGKTDLKEGTFCTRTFDGKSGYCLRSHQCLHVVRDFREHRTKIDLCSYQKNIPIICCPLEDKEVEREENLRIIVRKCNEYYEAASRTVPRKRIKNNAKKCIASIPLIVGGEKTYLGEYPHMAAVGWTNPVGWINYGCGGSLISEQFVLTASHCTKHGGKEPDTVRLGDYNLKSDLDDSNVVKRKIVEIINHPKYKFNEYYNDIALLKLEIKVEFSQFVKPACLWPYSNLDEVKVATATGWGRTEYLGPKASELLKVDLKIIDNLICNRLYEHEGKLPLGITEQQFCAGYMEGGKDTCQGDSGGPIHVQTPKYNCVPYIIGITSFGKICAAPGAPGVYTKLFSYLDWIESIAF